MKNINKILGIVLAVAMLAGLMIFAVPASAGDLSWSQITVPSATTSSSQLTANTNITLMKFAPDGKTAFAWDNTAKQLYKSGDGGVTWTTTNIGTGINAGSGNLTSGADIIAMAISPNYATDTTLIVATSGMLLRSRNGGQTFLNVTGYNIAPAAPITSISSIDIAPYYISTGGTALLVAGTGGISEYDDNDNWFTVANNSTTGFTTSTSILTAEFSPNYQNDGEILAVVGGITNTSISGVTGTGTVLETKFATADWNKTVRPAQLLDTDNNPFTGATTASLAFPSDYDSSSSTLNRVYVALGGGTGTPSFDAWRVNGSINSTGSVVKANNLGLASAGASANTVSLAYTGTTASGTLVAGETSDGVWAATTPNATASWTQALNPPTGGNIQLVFPKGSTTLYAASQNAGSPAFGSAIATSTDYNSFKEISLISIPALANLSLSEYKINLGTSLDQFVMVSYTQTPGAVTAGDVQMIFKSTDGGTTWAEVFDNVSSGTSPVALTHINPSPTYATDNTVYAPTGGSTVYKSTDGGATWNSIAATIPAGDNITTISVIDANTYWIGSSGGGIYKSGSYAQVASLDGNIPFAIIPLPFGIVVATNSGYPIPGNGSFYLSTDNGATFSVLGTIGQFTGGYQAFTFDVPNNTIYAAKAGGNEIVKWVAGSSTAWVHVVNVSYNNAASTPASTPAKIGWLNLAGDGTLYAQNNDTTTTSYQILRCVNIGAPEQYIKWVGIAGTLPGATNAASNFGNAPISGPNPNLQPASQTVVYNSTGKFDLIYQIVGNTANGTTQNNYPAMIEKFTDTMVLQPVITAPAADAQVSTSFNIAWNAVPAGSNTVTYDVDIATDSGFNNIINTTGNAVHGTTTNGTSYFVNGATGGNVPLVQGTKYYLRVSTTAPYPSRFSATQAFTVALGVTGNTNLAGPNGTSISPGPGATNVPVNATFQWAAVAGATGYHIQVADNPGFTTPIADATTTDTFFTLSSPLNPGTVYYWRIQATAGTVTSDYVTSVFTTAAAPTAPVGTTTAPVQTVQPTITVVVPPASPAPVSTPAYIWVIIAIGAVLVIAVIVLIARTRRV